MGRGKGKPVEPPKSETKKDAPQVPAQPWETIINTPILRHKEWPSKKEGGNPTYQIIGLLDGNEQSFTTFSKTDFALATSETGTNVLLRLEFAKKTVGEKTYYNIVSLKRAEEPATNNDDVPF